ncbi:MAG: BspA family leucine-rich repeat surface protein [Mollicutes bacterium]|nr:BspA family leucine-rich repeat surface protein [Mollicutes bacterium]
MKRNNIIKILLVSFITLILLSIFSYTYAFFSLQIEGTGKDIVMSTGDLRLEYKDEIELKFENAVPGDTISKVITVKNIGTKNVSYSLYWGNLINTIDNYELHVTLDCKSYTNYGEETQTESGTCENIYRAVPISDTVTTGNIKGNISIDPNITHEYTVTLKFDNKNYNQNNNKNETFRGQIGIKEYIEPEPIYCTFDGEMLQGAEYVNGQYTYRYMQEVKSVDTGLSWVNIEEDGWGVQLTDKTSTEPVTSKLCRYINNKPVTSMSYMFSGSEATTIDLSSFDTSKVTDMTGMFERSHEITTLDLSSFDTSNVTSMFSMFSECAATTLDLSNFDTSNVTNMSGMFSESAATTIDLSKFNTSKVTNMANMFKGCKATTLDLSSFNTKNVNDMSFMFDNSSATTIDLSGFDTSKVTDMERMFYLNSNLKTIYASDNFNTNAVTSSDGMFDNSTNLVGGAGTTYNRSYIDKRYARIDGGTSSPGYFTAK